MTLTPAIKFALIASAVLVNLTLLAWTGIKIDVLALGMKQEVFNIGLTVLTILNSGVTAILAYLGMRAPVLGEEVREVR